MEGQADRRVAQDQRSDGDDDNTRVEQPDLLEHGGAKDRNVTEQVWLDLAQSRNFRSGSSAEDLAVGESRCAEHQDVDADPGYDLVGAQCVAEDRLQQGEWLNR